MFWKILVVLIISMIPLVELRGAIPVAVGMDLGLPEWLVLVVAIIGNIIPVPIIYFFARKFLEWGAKRKWKPLKQFCNFCLKKGTKAGEKLLKKTGEYGAYFALFLFVAVPIPGTGAWTGTLAASILNLNFKKTFIAITSGILVAGLLMLLISLGLFRWLF
ncbi:small multi-drug export protein [Candidatus Saccharibacteria bacterium]|nr:small multi-drug export protein [Candidatus Saccharibacteria bacterium]MBQ6313617.1 small multi-drug export protein [Candidatus Saccharibacteria bacterium]